MHEINNTKQGLTGLTALLGGNWNNGVNAGTFYWNLNNAASTVNRNISSQAFFVKIDNCPVKPCLLAKHKNIKTCAGRGHITFESSVTIQRPIKVLP